MVRKCCVSGCKSNYPTTLKANKPYMSIFGFPRNEQVKDLWLKAIARKNYTPSIYSGVCEKHFDKNDILKYDKYLQPDGTIQYLLVKRPRLRENAVPQFLLHAGCNKRSNIKIEEVDIKNQCLDGEKKVIFSSHDSLFPDCRDIYGSQEVKFEYVDIAENFIKEEIVDDDTLVVEHGNERIHKSKISSTLKMNEIGYECSICGESFTEALDLLAHAEVHVRGFDYRCMVCGEDFIDEEACRIHTQEQHSKEKVFPCSKCSKTFSGKARLKSHALTHPNKDFSNDAVDAKTAGKKTRKSYRRCFKKSNQMYPCRVCGKTFSTKNSQQIHIRKHTGERPFECNACLKAFRDSGSLRKHERIHTSEKPYVCVVCTKAFNQRVVLRNHILSSHSAPDPINRHCRTPYYCPVCTDMFATSQELIAHLILHCDMNTAMKISSETGQRKFKSITRLKSCGTKELDCIM